VELGQQGGLLGWGRGATATLQGRNTADMRCMTMTSAGRVPRGGGDWCATMQAVVGSSSYPWAAPPVPWHPPLHPRGRGCSASYSSCLLSLPVISAAWFCSLFCSDLSVNILDLMSWFEAAPWVIFTKTMWAVLWLDSMQLLPSSTVADLFCLINYQHFVADPVSNTLVFAVF